MVRVRIHGILKEVRKVLMKYSKYLIVLVNGRRVYDLDGVQLLPTDVVDLMIPVGGG